jgi:uncharacterized GH25 family protein
VAAAPASAHYAMLLPSSWQAKKGETVTLTYQWGHPFEHQLSDAPKPEKLVVVSPDKKTADLTAALTKTEVPGAEGKKVTAWRVKFTPEERGDYVFFLQAAPIFLEEEGEFVHDTAKVVLHVQAQRGWDAASRRDFDFEMMPLTRPYGLKAGMVFQAWLGWVRREEPLGLPGVPVEVERYNATPPKELPPDEQITRVVKTGPDGVATCTLTEPGWWALTAAHLHYEKRTHDGKERPVKKRTTLWVFVDGR